MGARYRAVYGLAQGHLSQGQGQAPAVLLHPLPLRPAFLSDLFISIQLRRKGQSCRMRFIVMSWDDGSTLKASGSFSKTAASGLHYIKWSFS